MLRRFLARWRRPPPSVSVTLYSRPGCHLCTEMKAELARARTAAPYELVELDIERDPVLLERHGRSIPVLEIGGKLAFKGRLQARDFERKFARRLTEIRAEEASRARGEGRESGHG